MAAAAAAASMIVPPPPPPLIECALPYSSSIVPSPHRVLCRPLIDCALPSSIIITITTTLTHTTLTTASASRRSWWWAGGWVANTHRQVYTQCIAGQGHRVIKRSGGDNDGRNALRCPQAARLSVVGGGWGRAIFVVIGGCCCPRGAAPSCFSPAVLCASRGGLLGGVWWPGRWASPAPRASAE